VFAIGSLSRIPYPSAFAPAALAGLVIVAVSVNINSILKYSHLPARAAAAIGRSF
jgi:hypothetical protein